jgi:hypothetical protein
MRHWHRLVRAAADGAAGGAAAPAGGADDKAEADAKTGGDASLAQLALAGAAGDDASADGKAAAGKKDELPLEPYRPEGLAENLVGKTDRDTIDSLAKALKGFQQSASRKGVPETPDGYEIKPTGDDDVVGHGLMGDQLKSVMDRARAAAHKAGVPAAAFEPFVREFAAADGDLEWLLPDDEAAQVSGRREMAALVEDLGSEKSAAAMLSQVVTTWNGLVKDGVFTGAITEKGVDAGSDGEEFQIMMGTARGARILSKLFSSFTGKDPIPLVHADATVSRAGLQEEMSRVLSMTPGPDRDAAYAEVQRKYEAAYPD